MASTPSRSGLRRFFLFTGAIAAALIVAVLIGARFGLFAGERPADLGAREGLLKPPAAHTWNSVSSQAARHPHSAYHVIAPLRFEGDGKAAFARLTAIVRAMPGATIVRAEPDYLYAEFRTPVLRFVDDAEFLLDEREGLIHMRSASRLGRKDFGVNRERLEAVRARFGGPP